MATIAAPENWMKGIAAIAMTAMQLHPGVCSPGDTRDRNLDPGSWLSRDMPKHSRIVAAMIDRQQTKIAAETTNRYSVAKADGKVAVMTCAGFQPRPDVAVCRFGIATSVPSRNPPPMMNAPITEYSTALGAWRRGSLVSSDSVEAVSKP